MDLKIKSNRAYEMARELAKLTGENLTQAVTNAIKEKLELERQRSVEKPRGISDKLRLLVDEYLSLPLLDARSHDEILYDEGLQK
ncbi:MAG: type II toxin-antitoxin system VapB family antitoxin [Bacteroidota bacterium]